MKYPNAFRRSRLGRPASVAALALSTALVLGACSSSDDGGGSKSDAAGVAAGATKEQYVAALADVDDIKLIAQVAGGPDSNSNRRYTEYFKAVEDWSGGKIKFEVNYSDAVVPATEIDDAIIDGRLDMGYVLPVYEPDLYKNGALMAEATVAGKGFPFTGTMNMLGMSNEVFFNTPSMVGEFTDRGIYPLVAQAVDGMGQFFCSKAVTSPSDLKGLEATVSSQSMATQFKEMGVTAVSLAFAEYYESVQRGVVDCVTTGGVPAELAGFVDQAPNVAFMTDGTFASPSAIFAINQKKWESLPLPAQQLMHDRIDAFFTGGLEGGLNAWGNVLATSAKEGGKLTTLDAASKELMAKGTEKVLDGVKKTKVLDGEKLVADAQEGTTKWAGILTDLGLSDPTPEEFGAFIKAGEFDIKPFVDKLMTEVYAKRRPE